MPVGSKNLPGIFYLVKPPRLRHLSKGGELETGASSGIANGGFVKDIVNYVNANESFVKANRSSVKDIVNYVNANKSSDIANASSVKDHRSSVKTGKNSKFYLN